MNLPYALTAVATMAAVILACRAFPFLLRLEQKRAPGRALDFIERLVPPVAMTVLAVSALASVRWKEIPHGVPEAAASAFVIAVHLWKRNALLSIVGGTAVFMAAKAIM